MTERRPNVISLFQDHSDTTVRYLVRKGANWQDAQDVVQTVFCRLTEVPPVTSKNLPALMYISARNELTNLWRKETKSGTVGKVELEERDESRAIAHTVYEQAAIREKERLEFLGFLSAEQRETVIEEYVGGIADERLRTVLEAMAPDRRTALILHEIGGYSYKEIGGILKKSANAIGKLISKGKDEGASAVGEERTKLTTGRGSEKYKTS